MKRNFVGLLTVFLLVMIGCQKEKSFEISNRPSEGSLQSETTGDCLPKTVNGLYVAATPLVPAVNTITVAVEVTKTGNYTIYSDTINGYFFRGTGVFTTTGTNTVTLRSNGTPFSAGINNFIINYGNTVCDVAIIVLPVGSTPAAFTLESTAGNCGGIQVSGSYATATALNFTNTVKVNVNVTAIGTYSISTGATPVNGMTFAAAGVFTTTGVQSVTLFGTGTPAANGNTTVPITAGTSTCSFVIPVGNPADGTLGGAPGSCTTAIVNGTYTAGVILTTANSVDIQVNVTTLGVYSITTNTVAGIKFAASGSFTTTGPQSLKLNGSGTPTASGAQTFTVTFGTSACTFVVPVAAPAGAAVYTPNCAGATVNGTYKAGTALTAANTIVIPVNTTTAGTYNITTTVTNGMIFTGSGTLALGAGTITLVGTGSTPIAAATPSNIPIPGATACNVAVTVTAATTVDWTFTIGTTVYQGTSSLPDVLYDVSTPPFSFLDYVGVNGTGEEVDISIFDLAGGITPAPTETYSTNTTFPTVNTAAFYFTNAALDLTAEPAIGPDPAVGNMVFIVTSHNTGTKTIKGTFSGTAFDAISNTTKTITAGSFTAVYQ